MASFLLFELLLDLLMPGPAGAVTKLALLGGFFSLRRARAG